jgi:hypothetical protein
MIKAKTTCGRVSQRKNLRELACNRWEKGWGTDADTAMNILLFS